jgi:uncharacterized protein (TIGR04255 family)
MSDQKHLKNAPIAEALIDIRIKMSGDFAVENLKKLQSSISPQYSENHEIRSISYRFESGKIMEKEMDSVIGYRFLSNDGKQIYQTRLDGFTFNRLKPYESWDSFKNEAYRLWKYYAGLVSIETITRIAVRYINHLEIPIFANNMNEYISAPLGIPPNLELGLISSLTRFVMCEPDSGATAIITQAMEPITNDKKATIILDIDVFKESPFGKEDAEAWKMIENFRKIKNDVFFKSIKKKTEELFQ